MRLTLLLLLLLPACAGSGALTREGIEQMPPTMESRASLSERRERIDREIAELRLERRSIDWWFHLQTVGDPDAPSLLDMAEVGSVIHMDGDRIAFERISDQALEPGQDLHLRRGPDYVGRIQLVDSDGARLVGLFDTEHTGRGSPPRVGDRVFGYFPQPR
jgi:hypothetical protein